MANRILRSNDRSLREATIPARLRDVTTGVPTEASDRRSISIFAMFAIDEPADTRTQERAESAMEDGICAFLPTACTETWSRR